MSVSWSCREMLVRSSFSSRSFSFREVTCSPSRPENGEEFTENTIESVGSSMRRRGSGEGSSASVMVSPIPIPSTPGETDDVAGAGFLRLVPVEPGEGEEPGDARALDEVSLLRDRHIVTGPKPPASDAADGEPAEIVAVVEVRDHQLKASLALRRGRGELLQDGIEEQLQVGVFSVWLRPRRALAGVGIEDGKVELILCRVEVDEQIEDLVHHFLDARVLAIDLVHHHQDGKLQRKRLSQNVARLRERALARVDEQHGSVDHGERPLDLAAEVRVARGVDDVDLRPVIEDRGVLRENGDAALPLELVRVHDALLDFLVGPESAALMEHGVDQSRFPVVDVGDDCEVADVFEGCQSDFLRWNRSIIAQSLASPSGPGASPQRAAEFQRRAASASRTSSRSISPLSK